MDRQEAERAVIEVVGNDDDIWRQRDNLYEYAIWLLSNHRQAESEPSTHGCDHPKKCGFCSASVPEAEGLVEALKKARHELLWFGVAYPIPKTAAEAEKKSPAIQAIDEVLALYRRQHPAEPRSSI